MMATEPCPACKRGDHVECWAMEAPLGVPTWIGCPCDHSSHDKR